MSNTARTTTRALTAAGVGSVELIVDDRGEGRPVLLLHGGAGPQSVLPFAQRLADTGRRVLTPTHPGFGGTVRPASLNNVAALSLLYVALLDELNIEDVTVIGNSVGGWIAVELALRETPRVSDLVLLDAVGIAVEGHAVADVSGLSLPEIQALSFYDPTPFRVDPANIPDSQRAIVQANAAALAVYAGSPSMADPSLIGRLSEVTIPTLILWGDSDGIVDLAYGKSYASAIPGARFRVLPASGHMPQLETPDAVLDAMREPYLT